MKLKIYLEQKIYALKLVNKINFGMRGIFDGKKKDQYAGILGEVVLSDYLGIGRPKGGTGYDKGIDFVFKNKKIDLKTMVRKVDVKPNYVCNLLKSQTINSETDYYLFASINKTKSEIEFLGYFDKTNLSDKYLPPTKRRVRDDGTHFDLITDNYEIPIKELKTFKELST